MVNLWFKTINDSYSSTTHDLDQVIEWTTRVNYSCGSVGYNKHIEPVNFFNEG